MDDEINDEELQNPHSAPSQDGEEGGDHLGDHLEGGHIVPVSIEREMERSYLDYAMSVIVARALPDVCDGLKPVHRRILFSMHESGFEWNRPYRKSARVVGDVIGKYHPHGDSAIYDALVRMAQDFSMRLPLLDGQGNFGSLDGDPPAAMRYTEVRMDLSASFLLNDIAKGTVDFQDNYDNSQKEPVILPARFPNLMVNGSSGIAVGMATNIPPHNLCEIVDGCLRLIEEPDVSDEELMRIIPGPDFPTGGIILGRAGCESYFRTGHGSMMVRGVAEIESLKGDRQRIVVREIPYQVNKAQMIEKIAELVKEKRIEGISDLRDESDRSGLRVVVELKRDAVADVVLNQLYKFSQLQSSFSVHLLALKGGRPETLGVRDVLETFLQFRETVIVRRTRFELTKARDRAHVLVGLSIAVAHIDKVVQIIRSSASGEEALQSLRSELWLAEDMATLLALIDDPRHVLQEGGLYRLSTTQARAILELRLQRLTALGRKEVNDELERLGVLIRDHLDILSRRERVLAIIRKELGEVREALGTKRLTQFGDADCLSGDDERFIPKEDVAVTVSHAGYIKRVLLSTYRAQRRGGKGRSGMSTRDDDDVIDLFVANTHDVVLFFSSRGMAYQLKVWRLPQASPQSRGRALVNLLPLRQGEVITRLMPLSILSEMSQEDKDSLYLMFATRRGSVRRNRLDDFLDINRAGKIAMKFSGEDDGIVGVVLCTEEDDIFLTTKKGNCIRFSVNDVRVFSGRSSMGVRGIRLNKGDEVISVTTMKNINITSAQARSYLRWRGRGEGAGNNLNADIPLAPGDEEASLSNEELQHFKEREQFILTVSEKGFGKRTSSYAYRRANRGGKGVTAMVVNTRNGPLVASLPVEDHDQVIVLTSGGTLLRCQVNEIRLTGRTRQGVVLLRADAGESVVSVERIAEFDDIGDIDDVDSVDEAIDVVHEN